VDISSQPEAAVENFKNEIALLTKLRGFDRIILMRDSEIDNVGHTISILLEMGDIDLRCLIEKNKDAKEAVDPNFLRVMWQHMLEAVETVHNANVVHGDLKPANFLFVRGTLKLIDFGIAKSIAVDQGTTNIERTNQVGTLNYMAPEALKPIDDVRKIYKVGRAADVWSLGCILYQLVYNQPPFPQNAWHHKIQAIVDEKYRIDFPVIPNRNDFKDLLDVMQQCLRRNPKMRPRINDLLQHPYVTFRNPKFFGTLEDQLVIFISWIQDGCELGELDFDSPMARRIIRLLADQISRGQNLRLPDVRVLLCKSFV
jgi:serine/threonine protein kinase